MALAKSAVVVSTPPLMIVPSSETTSSSVKVRPSRSACTIRERLSSRGRRRRSVTSAATRLEHPLLPLDRSLELRRCPVASTRPRGRARRSAASRRGRGRGTRASPAPAPGSRGRGRSRSNPTAAHASMAAFGELPPSVGVEACDRRRARTSGSGRGGTRSTPVGPSRRGRSRTAPPGCSRRRTARRRRR